MRESIFRRVGLGYEMEYPEIRTTFAVDRIRVGRGETHGDVSVKTLWLGAQTYENDVLHYSRENLSSSSSRKSVASALASKAPPPEGQPLFWFGFYDEFCTKVLLADRDGIPIDEVGQMPDRIGPALVFNPLIPVDGHSILFGDGGVGKSITAAAVAVSIKTGVEIIPGFIPLIVGEPLYINWETTRDDIDIRVKAICAGIEIRTPTISHMSGRGKPLYNQIEAVARAVDQVGASVIIIDSIGKAMGASGEGPIEDSANRFASALDEIGRPALCIDHVSKAGSNEEKGAGKPIGSTMKSNWARATWEMRQASVPDADGTLHVAFYHRKHNTTAKHPAIGLAMSWADGAVSWQSEIISDATLSMGVSIADRITDLLLVHPLRDKEIAKELGESEASVRTILYRRKDKFMRIQTGDWAVLAKEA